MQEKYADCRKSPSLRLWALQRSLRSRKSGITLLTVSPFSLPVWQHEVYWLVEGTIAPASCSFSILA